METKITKIPSPNFGERNGYKPEIIVLHIMAGTLEGTNSWFKNQDSQVSSNYGVGLKGQIVEYVPSDKKAWANGIVNKPSFKLLKPSVNPNLYTISIENEGQDLCKAPEAQLNALVSLIRMITTKYKIPIDRDHIIGHYQVDGVKKPNCPATDKSIIDKIVKMAVLPEEMIQVMVPKSKLEKVLKYMNTI
jgi:N-acetylmuramoyl-L-alanine amidase